MFFLAFFTIIILIIVIVSIFNERFIKIPNEISILLFTIILSLILKAIDSFANIGFIDYAITTMKEFNFESYLLDGVLCFMLFAGASGVRFNKFTKNIKNPLYNKNQSRYFH